MPGSLRQRVRATAALLWRQHASPRRLAQAVFAGCLVGASPLFGFHLPLCIALAAIFRLNLVVTYLAAHISLPVLLPFLAFACVQAGELLRHGRFLALNLSQFAGQPPGELVGRFFLSWLIGGVPVGGLLGAIGGGLIWRAARLRGPDPETARAERITAAIDRALRRMRGARRTFRYYQWWKVRLDPCYDAVAARIPPGAFTVDLGCGFGLLPLLLAELGEGRRALGIEHDPDKAGVARAAAATLPSADLAVIREADALAAELPPCDALVMIDLLHYFPSETQHALLARAAAALKPGGRLLIREMDPGASRGTFSRFTERVSVRWGWNRADRVAPLTPADHRASLEAAGLAVTVEPLSGPLHPGNVLIEGVRKS